MSGQGAGNNLGNLHGNLKFQPSFDVGNTSVQPSFQRIGELNSFSTKTGCNVGGLDINHHPNPATTLNIGGFKSSAGPSQVHGGVFFNF
jgi:hypothetical protein